MTVNPDSVTIQETASIGLFLETFFYGIYTVTLGQSIRILLYRPGTRLVLKKRKEITWWLACAVILLAIILTTDLVLFLRYNFAGFIINAGSSAAFPDNGWIQTARRTCYVLFTAVADAVLIYRFFRLFNRNHSIVAVLILLYLTAIVCAIVVVSRDAGALALPLATVEALEIIAFAFTAIINSFVSSLILAKVWRSWARTSAFSSDPDKLLLVGRIILDSGSTYTIGTVLTACTLPLPHLAELVSDATMPIAGIAFNLLIIRLNGITQGSTRSDEDGSIRSPHPSGRDYSQRIVIDSERTMPLSAFKVVTDSGSDLGSHKRPVDF